MGVTWAGQFPRENVTWLQKVPVCRAALALRRPKILTHNGNLIFVPATNGSVYIQAKAQDYDLSALYERVQLLEAKLKHFEVKFCSGNPCKNGGKCVESVDSFTCICPPQWKGSTCEIDVDECSGPHPCAHGFCTNKPGNFSCTCYYGWAGDTCETSALCSPNPCKNGGQCNGNFTDFECFCPEKYFGPKCGGDYGKCAKTNQFQCESDASHCIDRSSLCDGQYDCADKSDEFRCCGGTYTGSVGYIRSPVEDAQLKKCRWIVNVPHGHFIEMNVSASLNWENPLRFYESDGSSIDV
ncbi:hypothetical protein ScPMuIL_012252 [Solemya velum]